jgi:hypothetical protein
LQLLISLDQLCAQYVTLIHDHLVVFALLLLLLLGLRYHVLKSSDIDLLSLDHVVAGVNLLADLLNVTIELGILLVVLLLRLGLRGDGIVLRLDFFLKLTDLLSHSSEFHL